MNIDITDIKVGKRLRELDRERVAGLAHSIKEVGLLNPITVTRYKEKYSLVAGLHRLEAYKLLSEKSIPATVVELDSLHSELAQIDENLSRNDLSALDQSLHVARRKEIYEALYPETKHGAVGRGGKRDQNELSFDRFTKDTSSKTGDSESVIKRQAQIGKELADYANDLRGTGVADNQSELLKIARMDEDTKKVIISRIVDKSAESATDAIQQIKREKAHTDFTAQTKSSQVYTPIVQVEDALKWLDEMPKCDLLLTDPPYSTDVDDIQSFSGWISNGLNKVKDTGHAYVFIGAYPEEVSAYLNQLTPKHMHLEQMLIWTYKNTLGQNPKDRYKLNYQVCLYYKGINAPNLNCPITNEQWAVIEVNAPDGRLGDRYHTWQKPIELAEMIVRHATDEGDTVYDPFTCTGTFLLAAGKLGRKSFGCDISRDNLEIAIERGCQYA